MIRYVVPENIDDRVVELASKFLREGQLIAFPADTSWVLACDPFNKKAVDKIYKFKNEEKLKHFSLICSSLKVANEVAVISSQVFRILNRVSPGHFTFILPARKKIMKSLRASRSDHEVGVRIIPIPWLNKLIDHFENPLLSTNITQKVLGVNEGEDIYSYLLEEKLSNSVSLILDPGDFEFVGQSTILNFVDEEEEVLVRQGAGPWP